MSCGCFFITWTIEIWIKNAAQHNPGLKFWRRFRAKVHIVQILAKVHIVQILAKVHIVHLCFHITRGVVTVWGVTHSGISLVPLEFKGYYFVM